MRCQQCHRNNVAVYKEGEWPTEIYLCDRCREEDLLKVLIKCVALSFAVAAVLTVILLLTAK